MKESRFRILGTFQVVIASMANAFRARREEIFDVYFHAFMILPFAKHRKRTRRSGS
jgi:hypothetical protein